MSDIKRIRRRQILSEAEGYLDLLLVFADRWPPSPQRRDHLASRALNILEALRDTTEDYAYVHYLRGQALRVMERFAEAVVPLKEASDHDPANIHIWLALGWCYKRIGRLDLAVESLESAIDFDPDEAILHYNLACYWSLAGNEKLAIEYLSNALDIDPDYRDMVAGEHDFDPIRNNPNFQALTSVIV